jgi:molybdopterin synthase catalytic subunit
MSVSIQEQDFDVAAELAAMRNNSNKIGGMVTFVGLVRDFSRDGRVDSITLEHYPGMSEKALDNIIAVASARWNLIAARVIHRVGLLLPNEQIVLVATASQHRGEAFAACEFIIDYLKTDAPFWKKEQTPDGGNWLETKTSDVQRIKHWSAKNGEAA